MESMGKEGSLCAAQVHLSVSQMGPLQPITSKKKYYFNPYNMKKKKRHMPMHKNKNKIILPG